MLTGTIREAPSRTNEVSMMAYSRAKSAFPPGRSTSTYSPVAVDGGPARSRERPPRPRRHTAAPSAPHPIHAQRTPGRFRADTRARLPPKTRAAKPPPSEPRNIGRRHGSVAPGILRLPRAKSPHPRQPDRGGRTACLTPRGFDRPPTREPHTHTRVPSMPRPGLSSPLPSAVGYPPHPPDRPGG